MTYDINSLLSKIHMINSQEAQAKKIDEKIKSLNSDICI